MNQAIDTVRDHGRQITALEMSIGKLAATEMSHYANGTLRIDKFDGRLERIERRLDLG